MSLLNPQPFMTVWEEMSKSPVGSIADADKQGHWGIYKDEEFLKWYDTETNTVLQTIMVGNEIPVSDVRYTIRPYHYTFVEAIELLKEKVEGRKVYYVGSKGVRTEINIISTIKGLKLEGLTFLQLVDGIFVKEGN
ncbi:hypothetical protein WKH56_19505 [Priestia sp. SB1]|uniref:hypothetical protein n=1 Tax=Priestia sp. SB1 TaxID=3132359 RepID=UPI00317FF7D3